MFRFANYTRCTVNVKLNLIRRDQPIMLIFNLLCYHPMLKYLTYYAQCYAHVKDVELKILLFY